MKLHVEASGRGPALVLLHGWGMHSGIWAPLLPQLAQRYRVSCIDLPGHGHSPAPAGACGLQEMAAAVAASAPPGAAWLGWSLGGQLALAAALEGHDISRLVLVATTPRFVTAADWPCGMAAATLAGFAAALEQDPRKTLRNFLVLQLRGDRRAAILPNMLRGMLEERDPPAPAALRAGLGILAGTDLRAGLASLGPPALVVTGQRDRLVPAEAGRRLCAALPRGNLLELPGAGHALFLTHPDDFLAAVAGFVPGQEAAA